ncbi:MAG TPA: hypothetical protein VN132_05175, partial [Bdellovibrio sp.]|nr:hypothetical protein [Bdellovibrio sp.]
IALQAEQLLGQPLHRANNKMDLQNCPKLCWVPVSASEAQELEKNNYIESVIKPLRRSYFTLNMNEFTDYDKTIIAKCEQEKRLDFSCFQALSIMNAQKRMKDPNKRYFFMNRYEDRGNYLLLQRQ